MYLYTIVENYILEKIKSGILKCGEMIEPETDLSKMFGVSRPTVRQAMNRLVISGHLIRVKGRGTFVTEPKVLHKSTSIIAGYRREISVGGHTLITSVLAAKTIPASNIVAKSLNIKVGQKVHLLIRVRRLDTNCSAPVVYTSVYVPVSSFPDMLSVDFESNSLYDTFEKNGIMIKKVSRTLEVAIPTRLICEALETSRFEPAIFISSRGYAANGAVVEFSQSYYPAQGSRFLIELDRENLT